MWWAVKSVWEEEQEVRTLKGLAMAQPSSVRTAKGLGFGPCSNSRVAMYWNASMPRRSWTESSGKHGKETWLRCVNVWQISFRRFTSDGLSFIESTAWTLIKVNKCRLELYVPIFRDTMPACRSDCSYILVSWSSIVLSGVFFSSVFTVRFSILDAVLQVSSKA